MSRTKQTNSILEKEEEYIRINAELEAKTAALVKQADSLLMKSSSKLNGTPLLDTAVSMNEDYLEPSNELEEENNSSSNLNYEFKKKVAEIAENFDKNEESHVKQKPSKSSAKIVDADDDDSCLEVQNRYLKAKLRVLQEDNEKLAKDYIQKQDDFVSLQNRIKEIEDERNRLQRTNNNQASQMEKSKKLLEDSKSKVDILESQISALKKEVDQSKRNLDQQNSSNKGNEVRLNRAVEEAAKLKFQLAQMKSSQKDSVDADKKKVDQLMGENRRLERQKAELVQAFRKQMQLIDVLKKQKMQIEVAKMLQFTEEEFVKALDWEK